MVQARTADGGDPLRRHWLHGEQTNGKTTTAPESILNHSQLYADRKPGWCFRHQLGFPLAYSWEWFRIPSGSLCAVRVRPFVCSPCSQCRRSGSPQSVVRVWTILLPFHSRSAQNLKNTRSPRMREFREVIFLPASNSETMKFSKAS